MLCAPARTRFLPSFSLSPPQPLFRRLNSLVHRRNHCKPITISAQDQVVEHIVLFKVKPDVESSKVAAMVNGLNGLSSLDLTGSHSPHNCRTTSPVTVVFAYLHSHASQSLQIEGRSEGLWRSSTARESGDGEWENEKARVLEVIGGIKDQFQAIEQLSFGENFSHDRAKGYTIASIAVLPGPADLEALDSNAELANLQKEKVKDLIESVVVVDYVIRPPQAANL
ncbi:hypothetical protein L6452_41811 [Arctium lappa]|uniref:Uncharacterized protein n=1 Tax=Arctium lappa TaxID=4217 RepID=A0ACB8XH08_ARCLA|nr:hypothetical protein L6452_41811 [Arctium lappa]